MIRLHIYALHAVFAVTAATLSIGHATAQITPIQQEALDRLTKQFDSKGHDLEPYFEHPDFQIYADIAGRFTGAPERTAGDAYLEALEKGDEEEAKRVFEDQYEDYKVRTSFEARTRQIGPFIEKYETRLREAEARYGIPAEVIAAVIGVESAFGATTGRYNPFNVYVSMYIADYRTSFALEQLSELVSFVERTGMDVFAMRSSYAGAIGYMQFIPASLNRWFVGDNVLDMNDNIDSVANYLSHFKKARGSLEEAIHAYNPSRFYVRLVMDLAEAGEREE